MIPADYWNGHDTLELEYPWLVPGAIVALDSFLLPTHRVLEFGCGGSTLFFARRCESVLGFESKTEWAAAVQARADSRGVVNTEVRVAQTVDECAAVIGDRTFDVVLVDSDDIPRLELAKRLKPRVAQGGCMILDNYDSLGTEGLDPSFFRGWTEGTFDDPHWLGRGTRIYLNGAREGFRPIDASLWGRGTRFASRSVPLARVKLMQFSSRAVRRFLPEGTGIVAAWRARGAE